MLEDLKAKVCRACQQLKAAGLVIQTEGNVSERSPDGKLFVIKPSGMSYDDLRPEHMVVVDLDGKVVDGDLNPSTDTPTCVEIYRARPDILAIAHTHSPFATAWSQGGEPMPLPVYGTTHADAFGGPVPVTRLLTPEEVAEAYERYTGKVILEVLPNPARAVFVFGHGPFTFGRDANEAVKHAEILEKVTMMAIVKTPKAALADHLLRKHYERKHGEGKYYGQG